ncbi:hypothetical protein [Rhizobium sp. RU36D]|uniref:hypothetical protein n=1 Tax=Rhizobium sp. RU36D TaxID=1907415 RepID=UPI0009D858E4|nr:hypothetical protein [Rhizobium sp. RU36D]SMC68778.1 hypothetical protein SAMN05880593_104306 [Rhizobium sp. RU36D]
MSRRNLAFMAILIALWLPGLAIIFYILDILSLGNFFHGDDIAIAIVLSGPIVTEDASLIGEATPFAAAGALVLLAPNKTETRVVFYSVCISAIGWLIYLMLSVLLNEGQSGYEAMLTIIQGATGSEKGISILQAFATGSRVVCLVVAASMLGLKFRRGN